MKKVSLAVAAIALLSAGCGESETRLETAYNECVEFDETLLEDETEGSYFDRPSGAMKESEMFKNNVRLEDDGKTIILDTGDNPSALGGVEHLLCLTIHLDTPEAVYDSITNTRAMDGIREREAEGLRYEWNYHPDQGLHLIVSMEEE